jgi:hypothetical protein
MKNLISFNEYVTEKFTDHIKNAMSNMFGKEGTAEFVDSFIEKLEILEDDLYSYDSNVKVSGDKENITVKLTDGVIKYNIKSSDYTTEGSIEPKKLNKLIKYIQHFFK